MENPNLKWMIWGYPPNFLWDNIGIQWDLPINSMVIFHGYVGLPEGNHNYQNWLVVWNMAFIGNVIIPTDEHIFQRGRLDHQPGYADNKCPKLLIRHWEMRLEVTLSPRPFSVNPAPNGRSYDIDTMSEKENAQLEPDPIGTRATAP